MLAQKNKLHLRTTPDFFHQAKRMRSSFFLVFYKKSLDSSKAIAVVPKKVLCLSSQRNASKRFLYQILEENWTTLIQKSVDVVFIQQKRINQSDTLAVKKDLATWITNLEVQ